MHTFAHFNEDWLRQIWEQNKAASFQLPCMVSYPPEPAKEHFFRYGGPTKRRRKVRGWICHIDRHHPVFSRFITRFYDDGNLTIGKKRYWGRDVMVDGIRWPPPKLRIPKIAKKSKLASLPVDDTEYVFLIRMGQTKHYKIGKSKDPQGRVASLQTASPYKLKLLHVFKADNASAAEETLHHKFHTVRKEGEWFKRTDEQRDKIITVTVNSNNLFMVKEEGLSLAQLFADY